MPQPKSQVLKLKQGRAPQALDSLTNNGKERRHPLRLPYTVSTNTIIIKIQPSWDSVHSMAF